MLNLCLCGSEAGYPHEKDCPYPLFRASDQAWEDWRTARRRLQFAREHGMTTSEVSVLVQLARFAAEANEHACNGDPHPSYPNASDKAFNAQRWGAIVDDRTRQIVELVKPYGFTAVEYTGIGPSLKRGDRWVEIPY
jgi:hypothetical protein